MKTLKNFSIVLLILSVLAVPAFAQTQPTKTTLASAMPAGSATLVVSSATGFATTVNGVNAYVLVEKDLRRVTGVSGTTITTSLPSGVPVAHPSGATVIFGISGNWNANSGTSNGVFLQSLPTGTCTRAGQTYLPAFVVVAANAAVANTVDCLNGRWIAGTLVDAPGSTPLSTVCTVPVGSVAYGSFGTSTTTSTTGEFTASIWVPTTTIFTGFTNLNGSAVDTGSKKIFILRDAGGNVLANTAVAGTASTGNDAFQAIAFTATRIVLGPALYAIGLQDDTADVNGVRTIAASTFNNVVASSITSVFGTVAAVTLPTTFTADTGPIGCLYK